MCKETIITLAIELINPFDADHVSFKNDGFLVKPFDSLQTSKHLATIALMKICILEGRKIRPLLVTRINEHHYKRLDGFCRYWACKELGMKQISCVLGDKAGGQSGLDPFIE